MNRRQELITDIEKFNSEVDKNQKPGQRWEVKKSNYLNLINRVLELNIYDFENQDMFGFFKKFITKVEITNKIKFVENSFQDNHLGEHAMLVMRNLFIDIRNKLK
jgi:hypothetical protein